MALTHIIIIINNDNILHSKQHLTPRAAAAVATAALWRKQRWRKMDKGQMCRSRKERGHLVQQQQQQRGMHKWGMHKWGMQQQQPTELQQGYDVCVLCFAVVLQTTIAAHTLHTHTLHTLHTALICCIPSHTVSVPLVPHMITTIPS